MNCGKAAVHYYLMSDVEVTCTELRRITCTERSRSTCTERRRSTCTERSRSTCTERSRSMVDVEILPPHLQSIHFGCAQCDGF
jgi:hypothetical protein